MDNQDSKLVALTSEDMQNVAGGSFWGAAARLGGKVLSKAALPLTIIGGAYDAYTGYSNARAEGKDFWSAAGRGALNAGTLGLSEEFRK
jgi:hypothetical protein